MGLETPGLGLDITEFVPQCVRCWTDMPGVRENTTVKICAHGLHRRPRQRVRGGYPVLFPEFRHESSIPARPWLRETAIQGNQLARLIFPGITAGSRPRPARRGFLWGPAIRIKGIEDYAPVLSGSQNRRHGCRSVANARARRRVSGPLT